MYLDDCAESYTSHVPADATSLPLLAAQRFRLADCLLVGCKSAMSLLNAGPQSATRACQRWQTTLRGNSSSAAGAPCSSRTS